MKHSRLFFIFALCITACFCSYAQAQNYFTIKKTDGTSQANLLSDIRKLTFSKAGDIMQVQFTTGAIQTDTIAYIRSILLDTTGGHPLGISNYQRVQAKFNLSQNYPNPFNPTTVITYQVPMAGKVVLKVYDVLGKEIATLVNGEETAGQHSVQFDARQVASGIYFYKLIAGPVVMTKKMLVIK